MLTIALLGLAFTGSHFMLSLAEVRSSLVRRFGEKGFLGIYSLIAGVLLALLVLPLYIPVLIFGSSTVVAAASGFEIEAQLSILGAIFLLSLSLAPIATAAALRVSAE